MGSRKNYIIVKRLTRKGFHAEMSGHIKLTEENVVPAKAESSSSDRLPGGGLFPGAISIS